MTILIYAQLDQPTCIVLNKYKYVWEIYNNEHITDSLHILYIYSEDNILNIHTKHKQPFYNLIGKTKVWVGPVVHKSILRF